MGSLYDVIYYMLVMRFLFSVVEILVSARRLFSGS